MKPAVKKFLSYIIIIIISLVSSVNAVENQRYNNYSYNTLQYHVIDNSFTNLTVEETWALLNDTSNGIQIPIDVRTDPEWIFEHINTPRPEHPRHHCKCEWINETILQEFISIYEGETIILYCLSGSRSVDAAYTLINNGFEGTIYNMLGGITAWKATGYPTIANQPPDPPEINGPSKGKTGKEYQCTISSIDPEDNKIFYYINWSDGTNTTYTGPHSSGQEIIVNHTWSEKGDYIIQVKAWDFYQAESDWSKFEVSMSKNKNLISSEIIDNILDIINEILNKLYEKTLLNLENILDILY
jgi:rhodanese-related sulfurtransferase